MEGLSDVENHDHHLQSTKYLLDSKTFSFIVVPVDHQPGFFNSLTPLDPCVAIWSSKVKLSPSYFDARHQGRSELSNRCCWALSWVVSQHYHAFCFHSLLFDEFLNYWYAYDRYSFVFKGRIQPASNCPPANGKLLSLTAETTEVLLKSGSAVCLDSPKVSSATNQWAVKTPIRPGDGICSEFIGCVYPSEVLPSICAFCCKPQLMGNDCLEYGIGSTRRPQGAYPRSMMIR